MSNGDISFRPSYFESKTILDRLQRFQDLLRHDQRWAHQISFARPLKELIPELSDDKSIDRMWLIDREINRLIPLVRRYLYFACIETVLIFEKKDLEWDFEKSIHKPVELKKERDAITDYFELPHSGSGKTFDMVMHILERGIGYYLARKEKARRELINPLCWAAFFLRMPLLILHMAGVETSNKIISSIYGWVLKVIMFFILILFATKLGISVPWDKVIALL